MVVGQVELIWIQNCPIRLKIRNVKTIYSLYKDNLALRGLQRKIKKVCKIVTVHHQELLKRRPSHGILCIQSRYIMYPVTVHYVSSQGTLRIQSRNIMYPVSNPRGKILPSQSRYKKAQLQIINFIISDNSRTHYFKQTHRQTDRIYVPFFRIQLSK
jgi:hypothetical protein